MGDRGQIKIIMNNDTNGKEQSVYLYTHWDGSNLKQLLQSVLKKHKRWDDKEYLTRMIFSAMIKEDIDGETGYGIGVNMHGDLNNPLLVIDGFKVIEIVDGSFTFSDIIVDTDKTWTFEEFIEADFQ